MVTQHKVTQPAIIQGDIASVLANEQELLDLPLAEDPTLATMDPTAAGRVGQRVVSPSPDQPLPAVVSDRTGLWVNLYRTENGEKITVLRWQAAGALRRRHKDKSRPDLIGKPMFALRPTMTFVLGQALCPLNPKHPLYARIAHLKLEPCPAEHLKSDAEAWNHFRKRHRSDFRTYEDDLKHREHEETLNVQRRQLEVFERMADKLTDKVAPVADVAVQDCPTCGETITGTIKNIAILMGKHKAKHKPKA